MLYGTYAAPAAETLPVPRPLDLMVPILEAIRDNLEPWFPDGWFRILAVLGLWTLLGTTFLGERNAAAARRLAEWAEAQPEPRGWFASTICSLNWLSSPWHLDPDMTSSFLVEELRAARIRVVDAERDAQAARDDQFLADERADAGTEKADNAEQDARAARNKKFFADGRAAAATERADIAERDHRLASIFLCNTLPVLGLGI